MASRNRLEQRDSTLLVILNARGQIRLGRMKGGNHRHHRPSISRQQLRKGTPPGAGRRTREDSNSLPRRAGQIVPNSHLQNSAGEEVLHRASSHNGFCVRKMGARSEMCTSMRAKILKQCSSSESTLKFIYSSFEVTSERGHWRE